MLLNMLLTEIFTKKFVYRAIVYLLLDPFMLTSISDNIREDITGYNIMSFRFPVNVVVDFTLYMPCLYLPLIYLSYVLFEGVVYLIMSMHSLLARQQSKKFSCQTRCEHIIVKICGEIIFNGSYFFLGMLYAE